ncbi:hypothetical protein LY78DRAFT_41159 [Colletotrichum sublineola]|nr:hypothetical protein LY78DRAFT_41159 [Colletotrichum sublineola]
MTGTKLSPRLWHQSSIRASPIYIYQLPCSQTVVGQADLETILAFRFGSTDTKAVWYSPHPSSSASAYCAFMQSVCLTEKLHNAPLCYPHRLLSKRQCVSESDMSWKVGPESVRLIRGPLVLGWSSIQVCTVGFFGEGARAGGKPPLGRY